MKQKLKVGERIFVRVEEVAFDASLIVDFAGVLFRVVNQTSRKFKPGDRVFLKVSAEGPLEFQIVDRAVEKNSFRFEREI